MHCFHSPTLVGTNIAKELQEILENWRLQEDKMSAITTDNGTNIVAALEINNGNECHVSATLSGIYKMNYYASIGFIVT